METTIYNLPIISGILTKTNTKAERLGMIEMMKDLITWTRSKVLINKSKTTVAFLKNQPVLVICNHPAEADVPFLLAALEKRDDAYLVASHQFLKLLPSIDKNIIPVFIGHRFSAKHDWKIKMFDKIHYSEKMTVEEAHKKNVASIKIASEKISNGGLVVIYPINEERNNEFMPGVGHLINQIENPEKAVVIMAHIEGTSNWDYLRLLRIFGQRLPKIKISFSEPTKAARYVNPEGKVCSKYLETAYYKWAGNL